MAGTLKPIALICICTVVLLGGCNQGSTSTTTNTPKRNTTVQVPAPEAKRIEKAVADEEKTRLLKQLDGKFEDPEAHYKLGKLYQRDGMWSKAENEFSTALSFDPVYRDAQAARVKVLLEEGETAKAKLLTDDYMQQASTSAAGSLKLGIGFQQEELDDYAIACYKQALVLAPSSAKVNRQIGYYYLRKNQSDLAREYLSRSFQLDPTQAEVAGELGRLGVVVQVRKPPENGKKLDDIVDKADKQVKP